MITLRLPGSHPNNAVLHNWAKDKESILNNDSTDIQRLQGIIKTILSNNPDLGKAK